MPGKHVNTDPSICKRCGTSNATLQARQEGFCTDCYERFITTKVVKRMEQYRVRDVENYRSRKLLLALSFRVSSLALLHMLDGQIKRQLARTGVAAFDLLVLHVNDGSCNPARRTTQLEAIKERYPSHSYLQCPLLDVSDEPARPNSQNENNTLNPTETPDITASAPLNLSSLLPSLPSASSRTDIKDISLRHTITKIAHKHNCEAVLWGSTTTTLAQKILAETAKGRGFSLPWLLNDGPSPYHDLEFRYPMRDLFKKEVFDFMDIIDPSSELLADERAPATTTVSSKDITIDGLMKEYFQSVEVNYPGIVANVVKTSGKLNAPARDEASRDCELCGLPVPDGRFGIHGWGAYQQQSLMEDDSNGIEQVQKLCYGCARSVLGATKAPP